MGDIELVGADLGRLDDGKLEEGICLFAGCLAAASCVFVLAIAEYDHRRAWERWECRSMAHWLTWKCALSPLAAREHVRVGAALARLPQMRAAFAAGELSYSQVRAATRVATPETESQLVDYAQAMTAAQLEVVVRTYRRCRERSVEEATQRRAARRLIWHQDDDGSLVGSFRLAPEEGAVVLKALEAAAAEAAPGRSAAEIDQDHRGDTPAEPDAPAAARADALVAVAGAFLAGLAGESEGGCGEPYLVTVIADAEVLTSNGDDDREGTCELEDGTSLAPETARRLACDAASVTILQDRYGRTLDVGRRTRRVTRAMRRALAHRDRTGRFPGCTATRTEAHHIRHWADGGPTRLDNLVALCSRHHHRHHEGGFRVEVTGADRFRFVRPDGTVLPEVYPPGGPHPAGLGTCGPAVGFCRYWDGGGLTSLGWIIDGLLRAEQLLDGYPRDHHPGAPVPAGTPEPGARGSD
ncbi:MAG: HNH endonuclease signature motif containing protein [Acidimicrobiales bacterium]